MISNFNLRCLPCLLSLKKSKIMLEKNKEKWKDKVRIVGMNTDEDGSLQDREKSVLKLINDEGLKISDHYLSKEKIKELEKYKIRSVPFAFLVDGSGAIVFMGNPLETDGELLIIICLKKVKINVVRRSSIILFFDKSKKQEITDLLNRQSNNQFEISIDWVKELTYHCKGDLKKSMKNKPKINLLYNLSGKNQAFILENELYSLCGKKTL